MSTWNRIRRGILGTIAVGLVCALLWSMYLDHLVKVDATQKVADGVAALAAIQMSTDNAQVKARKSIELYLGSRDAVEAGMDAANPGNTLRDRVLAYTRLG